MAYENLDQTDLCPPFCRGGRPSDGTLGARECSLNRVRGEPALDTVSTGSYTVD